MVKNIFLEASRDCQFSSTGRWGNYFKIISYPLVKLLFKHHSGNLKYMIVEPTLIEETCLVLRIYMPLNIGYM